MKTMRVGDPHLKSSNIDESDALMRFVVGKCLELKVDRLEILGDLFDSHDIVRLKVLKFWDKWLNALSLEEFKTIVLVGNHDLSGSYDDKYSSLSPFKSIEHGQKRHGQGLKIVDEPYIDGLYGYLPYIHDNRTFIDRANELAQLGAKVLVSHPNFEGAVYDNGSPITGAVNPDDLDSNFLHLIGGHIHTEIEIGRVWYTGNPRWLTKSCANKKKGIWLCTHNDTTGAMENKEFISTESVCTPIISLVWKEGEDKPEIPSNAKTNIELIGSSDWVTKTKKELVGSVSISSKLTDIKKSKERKSGKSLHEFLSIYYQISPEKKDRLLKYMGELNFV